MTTTEKQRVIARLVKWGHNERNATQWADEHYEYVSKHYKGISKMAEVISSLD